MTETAAIVALVGVAAAVAAIASRGSAGPRPPSASLVLAAPTLAGHALDPHRLRWLVALADLAHVVGAAVWIGGLTLLVARAADGATASRRSRSQRSRVLAGAAIPRALAAFPSLHSLFHTSYGQAVIVKTGLLAVDPRRRLGRTGAGSPASA